MAGRSRGARSGRGWDAAPARARTSSRSPGSPTPAAQAAPTDLPGQWVRPKEHPDPEEAAREICLRLLAVRPRTRAELATALRRRGIPEKVACALLDRYRDVGLVDDAAFARAWVASRHHGKGLARRALAGELRRRGIDDETVRAAVEELDADTEAATARALVDRRLRGANDADPQALLRRLVGMLARKGYSADLAFRVVKEALAANASTAELADCLDADALADAALGESGEPPPG